MTDLDQVLARFPHCANEIRRLVMEDRHFRSICEDLLLAYGSLNEFAAKGAPSASESVRELRILRDELETELLAYLDRSTPIRGSLS